MKTEKTIYFIDNPNFHQTTPKINRIEFDKKTYLKQIESENDDDQDNFNNFENFENQIDQKKDEKLFNLHINGAIFTNTKFQAADQCQICPQVAGWESKSFSLKYNDEKGLKEKLKEKLGANNNDKDLAEMELEKDLVYRHEYINMISDESETLGSIILAVRFNMEAREVNYGTYDLEFYVLVGEKKFYPFSKQEKSIFRFFFHQLPSMSATTTRP